MIVIRAVRGRLRGYSRLLDGALAAILVFLSLVLPSSVAGASSAVVIAALTLGLCAPVVIRRRWPVAAFVVVALVAFVQWLLDVLFIPADAVLFAALYNVASRCRFALAAAAAAVLEIGAVLAVWRWIAPLVDPAEQEALAIAWSNLAVGSVLVVSVWIWGHSVRTRRAYLAELEERAVRLERERDHQARLVAAAERARIARELHDVVAHSLSVMVAQSDGAAYVLETDSERAQQAMRTVSATGREAQSEMRRLVGVLRDDESEQQYTPQPGVGELEDLVAQTRGAGLPVEFTVEGVPVELPHGQQLAAYRVVQEALTNTVKHAGGGVSGAAVSLRYGDEVLELRIADDGRGAAAGTDGQGHGLVGMRERMAVYGGNVRAGPRTGGGYEVVATLPLE